MVKIKQSHRGLEALLNSAAALLATATLTWLCGCLSQTSPDHYDLHVSPGSNEPLVVELPNAQRIELCLTFLTNDESRAIRLPLITLTNANARAVFELQVSSADIRGTLINAVYAIDTRLLRQLWRSFDGRVGVFLPNTEPLLSVRKARLVVWPDKADAEYNRAHGLPNIQIVTNRQIVR